MTPPRFDARPRDGEQGHDQAEPAGSFHWPIELLARGHVIRRDAALWRPCQSRASPRAYSPFFLNLAGDGWSQGRAELSEGRHLEGSPLALPPRTAWDALYCAYFQAQRDQGVASVHMRLPHPVSGSFVRLPEAWRASGHIDGYKIWGHAPHLAHDDLATILAWIEEAQLDGAANPAVGPASSRRIRV